MVAEKNFRKLNALHLVGQVAEGRPYSNGVDKGKWGSPQLLKRGVGSVFAKTNGVPWGPFSPGAPWF